jgi:hypothetical protein
MPRQEKHPKVNAAGEIIHVFGHRFVLKTGSKSVLADLMPRGLQIAGLRIGDRVALEGEQKPSEIKVSSLNATEKHLHSEGPGRKPKHFEVLEKKAPSLRSITSSSTSCSEDQACVPARSQMAIGNRVGTRLVRRIL